MTPTPREVPVWPHRPVYDSLVPYCPDCHEPWGDQGCPSQQYLDGLVAAVKDLLLVSEHVGVLGATEIADAEDRLHAILEGARATDDEARTILRDHPTTPRPR